MKSRLFALCSLIFFVAPTVFAQSVVADAANIILDPSSSNPVPGQTITIKATSYSIDLNSATISWLVNGETAQNGVGATSFVMQAPPIGKKAVVQLRATTAGGMVASASISIGSGSVDMIAESSGMVPSIFKGKIPLSYQNTVTVTAIPHIAAASGQEYDPKTLVYTWKKDDTKVLQSQSGYGKQSISIEGSSIARPFVLSVVVATRDGSAQAEGSLVISYTSPRIIFYVDDPLYGALFNKSVAGSIHIGSQKEVGVLALPYGFDADAGLNFTWLVNSIKRAELVASRSIILRAPDNTTGTSQIELDIRNTDKIVQGASSGFSATFSADAKDTGSDLTI